MRNLKMISLAAILTLSQAAYAESQNPHDPSNQPSDIDTDIHADTGVNADVNANTNTGSSNAATPNPNSLGRTGRLRDPNNIQRNQGVQTLPSNQDNISDRIEDTNDDDRHLHDRLDGRQSPTVDPAFNSDMNPATPVLPPGQGPEVNPAGTAGTDADSNTTSGSGAAAGASTSTNSGTSINSGSGSTNGSGSTSGTAGGSSGVSSGASGGAR